MSTKQNIQAARFDLIDRLARRLAALTLVGRWLLLALAVAGAFVLVGPLAYLVGGEASVVAAAVAAAVCLIPSCVALLLFDFVGERLGVLSGMLAAMFVRMSVPLVAGMYLHMSVPRLAAAGLLYSLVVFYLVTLLVETLLLLVSPQLRSPAGPPRIASET